jgi:hypothetical protein
MIRQGQRYFLHRSFEHGLASIPSQRVTDDQVSSPGLNAASDAYERVIHSREVRLPGEDLIGGIPFFYSVLYLVELLLIFALLSPLVSCPCSVLAHFRQLNVHYVL